MPKYHVTLQSGRDFILNHPGDEYDIAYEAYEEACLMDDYLVDIVPIYCVIALAAFYILWVSDNNSPRPPRY